jgi:hypothetical protein
LAEHALLGICRCESEDIVNRHGAVCQPRQGQADERAEPARPEPHAEYAPGARDRAVERAAHNAMNRSPAGLEYEVRVRVRQYPLDFWRALAHIPLHQPEIIDKALQWRRRHVRGEPDPAPCAAGIDDALWQMRNFFHLRVGFMQ